MTRHILRYFDGRWRFIFAVFFISFAVYSIGIGRSSIYILDESKNAQCAWEMLHSSDHVVPTFNGELRTDKPPLHYYIMMLSYSVLGKSAFAARLGSSVVGAILMVVLALFVRRYKGIEAAFWTLAVLWSSIMWATEFHLAVPDPYLIACIGVGLMSYFHFDVGKSRHSIYVAYLFLSLGFLAKGPVAVVLPAIAILIYKIADKSLTWQSLKDLKIVWGIAILCIVALPWYFLVYKETDGGWIRGFLFEHNIERFAQKKEGHGGIFLLTWLYFWVGMLPFSVFVVGIIRETWRKRTDKLVLFSMVVVAVFILFFSVSRTKLPNYVMPCFPFAAILFGIYFSEIKQLADRYRKKVLIAFWILFGISVVIPVGLTVGVAFEPLVSHVKTLGVWLSFLPVGVLISIRLFTMKRVEASLLAVSFTFILTIFVIHWFLIPKMDKFNPVKVNLERLKEADSVTYFRRLNPSFVFNYGVVREMKDTICANQFLRQENVLLITSKRAFDENPRFWSKFERVYTGKDLFDGNTTIIVKCKN